MFHLVIIIIIIIIIIITVYHLALVTLQSTLNHQSHTRYSCWNSVPLGHRKLNCNKSVTYHQCFRGTKYYLGQLLGPGVCAQVEGLAASVRVSVVSPVHLKHVAQSYTWHSRYTCVLHLSATREPRAGHGGQRGVVAARQPGHRGHGVLLQGGRHQAGQHVHSWK